MTQATVPTSAPILQVFYDGACPLCSREMRHYAKRDRAHRVEWVDIARADFDAAALGLDAKRLQEAMHARAADGRIYTGVEAFVQIWRALPWGIGTGFLRAVLKVPGMMGVARWVYRVFARNRYRLTGRCTPESCGIDGPKNAE